MRVFRTMHSPRRFQVSSVFISIVLWLARPRLKGLVTACLSTIVLVFSEVRTAWMGFAVSTLFVLLSARAKDRARVVVLAGLAAFCVVPVLLLPEVADSVTTRFASFGEPDNDQSALSRVEGHLLALDFVATHPFGAGIGASDARIEQVMSMRDSMLVAALVQFGLVGTFFYAAGVCVLFREAVALSPLGANPGRKGTGMRRDRTVVSGLLRRRDRQSAGAFFWLIGGLAVAHGRRHRAWSREEAPARDDVEARPALEWTHGALDPAMDGVQSR